MFQMRLLSPLSGRDDGAAPLHVEECRSACLACPSAWLTHSLSSSGGKGLFSAESAPLPEAFSANAGKGGGCWGELVAADHLQIISSFLWGKPQNATFWLSLRLAVGVRSINSCEPVRRRGAIRSRPFDGFQPAKRPTNLARKDRSSLHSGMSSAPWFFCDETTCRAKVGRVSSRGTADDVAWPQECPRPYMI